MTERDWHIYAVESMSLADWKAYGMQSDLRVTMGEINGFLRALLLLTKVDPVSWGATSGRRPLRLQSLWGGVSDLAYPAAAPGIYEAVEGKIGVTHPIPTAALDDREDLFA